MKVLVLIANGLHAGFVGAYGNDWVGTPALDRLAAEGVVFDQHVAGQPDAEGAHHAWGTGRHLYPLPHGRTFAVPADPVSLVATLRAGGVFTALVCDRHPPPAGFAADWDGVDVVEPEDAERALETTLEAVDVALDELADVPKWLLWVELNTLLPPWTFPDEFYEDSATETEPDERQDDDAETDEPVARPIDPTPGLLGDDPDDRKFLALQDVYAAAVRYLDAGLEHLLEGLGERHLLDEVVVVVTSDRGAVLGEHGQVGIHRPWLHEELVHLPLIVRTGNHSLAGRTSVGQVANLPEPRFGRQVSNLPHGAGRHVPALTQPVDLMPTLLEWFEQPVPDNLHGYSLVPLLNGEEEPVREYACVGLQVGMALEWALRTPLWSFLLPLHGEIEDQPRQPQLFVRPADRWEINDVQQHHQELVEYFRQLLHDFVTATQQPGPLRPPPLRDVEAKASPTKSDDGSVQSQEGALP